jgi:hypothetical protein
LVLKLRRLTFDGEHLVPRRRTTDETYGARANAKGPRDRSEHLLGGRAVRRRRVHSYNEYPSVGPAHRRRSRSWSHVHVDEN